LSAEAGQDVTELAPPSERVMNDSAGDCRALP
jgi:hypothetical protein